MTDERRSPAADPYGMRLTTAQLALAREWSVPTPRAASVIASWARTLDVEVAVIVDLVFEEIVSGRVADSRGDEPDVDE